MIPVPSGAKVWLVTGHTDMRRGFPGLSLMVQETLRQDPMSGHLFVFRGRSGGLIKMIWHDGQGACLFTKKLERGRLIWPSAADGMGHLIVRSPKRYSVSTAARPIGSGIPGRTRRAVLSPMAGTTCRAGIVTCYTIRSGSGNGEPSF